MTTTPSGTKFEAFNLAFSAGDVSASLGHLLNDLYRRAWEHLVLGGLVPHSNNAPNLPSTLILRAQLADLIRESHAFPDRKDLKFGTEIIQALYSAKLALDGSVEGVKTSAERRSLLVIYGIVMGQMLAFSQLGSSGHIDEHNDLVRKLFPIGKAKGAKVRGQQKMQSAHAWQSECEPKIIKIAKRPSIKSRRMLIRLLRGDGTITNALPRDDRAIENFMKNLEGRGAIRSFGRAKK